MTDILKKLDLVEQALKAKGHPMQEYSTFKMALLDIIGVIREMNPAECTAKKKTTPAKKKTVARKKS